MKAPQSFTPRLLLVSLLLLAVSHPARPSPALSEPTSLRESHESANSRSRPLNLNLQQQDGWVALKTDEGLLFVWNVKGLYFTLAIKGKEITPVDDPEHIFFTVDGRVLQIQVPAIEHFAPDAKEKKLDDRAILTAHRDWESKFIEALIKSKLTLQTFNAKLSTGGVASMWQFDMPESLNSEAKKQLYLTIVRKDYVLMLNTEATVTISDADARKFLLDTIATLKVSPTPIDVKKLSESISKGGKGQK